MPYAENKSLNEYGELASQHHTDVQMEKEAGERQLELENQPAFLQAILSIGGSYTIHWSKGDAEVPIECRGLFTGTTQANAAIEMCMKRLTVEAEAAAEKEAKADNSEPEKTVKAVKTTKKEK